MTTDKNNSIIKISSDELVQHKNKFKSIAIYNKEIYESETVELINEANKDFGTLVLKAEATEDKKGLVLSPDWIKGKARTGITYTWKALASDGHTDLTNNENIEIVDGTLTIVDQTKLTSAITITAVAYKEVGSDNNKQNIFVAQSTPYTVFEKGQKGEDGPSIKSEVKVYKWSEEAPETGGDGWKTIEDIEQYDESPKDSFLWTCYRQEWTDGRAPTYTTPIRMTDYEMGTLMASKENISISQWCEKYGRTLIDGSTVATGGLIAETIQSGNYYNFGLKFEDYGSGYTAKLNSIVPEVVIVPAIYNNKPVLNIDITSFQQENAKNIIKKLAIPASVTTDLFGLLTGYTVLEELHIPIHKIGYNKNQPYFNNYFGNGSYEVTVNSVPAMLNKVYLSGTSDTTIVPLDYFDMVYYPEALKYDVYLTESISGMEAQEDHGAVNKIYRYGTPEIDDASIIVEQLSGAYSYPNIGNTENITGFRITSKEWEPMINSENFKVTQDGTIYAKNGEFTGTIHAQEGGDIAGWNISEDAIYKNNVALSTGDGEMDSLVTIGAKSKIRFKVVSDNKLIDLTSSEQFTHGDTVYLYSAKCPNYGGNQIEYNTAISAIGYQFGDQYGTMLEDKDWGANDKKVYYDKTKGAYCIEFVLVLGGADYLDNFQAKIEVKNNSVAILEDGSLYAQAADIAGTIAAEKGKVGGWEINQNSLSKTTSTGKVGLYAGEDSDIRIYAGQPQTYKLIAKNTSSEQVDQGYTEEEPLEIYLQTEQCNEIIGATYLLQKFQMTGLQTHLGGTSTTYDLIEGESPYGEDWGIVSSSISYEKDYSFYLVRISLWVKPYIYHQLDDFSVNIILTELPQYAVYEDGSLYANDARIRGIIQALDGGEIGGAKIRTNSIQLTGDSSIAVGSGGLLYREDSKTVVLQNTKGNVEIGSEQAKLIFPKGNTDVSKRANVAITMAFRGNYDFKLSFKPESPSPISASCSVKIEDYFSNLVGQEILVNTSNHIVNISEGQTNETAIYWTIPPQPVYRPTYLGSVVTLENTIKFDRKLATTASEVDVGTWTYEYSESIPAIISNGSLVPRTSPSAWSDSAKSNETGFDLGTDSKPWRNIYAASSVIHWSDKKLKNNIQSLTMEYEELFNTLKPVSYKFNVNDSNRTHIGLIAQDVKESVENAGLTTQDFAGYCEWENEDGSIGCGLRYGEFIALNVNEIQKLKTRAKQAEETIELQDAYIKKLEERIERLEQRLL